MTNRVEGLNIKVLEGKKDNTNVFASSLVEKCSVFLCLLETGVMTLGTMVTTANLL